MRVLIAGLIGAILMFVWSFVAHMALPLGELGFQEMPHDGPVLAAAQQSLGETDGLYFFPATGLPADERMKPENMAAYEQKLATTPSGIMLYRAPGYAFDFSRNLAMEFGNEFLQSLLAAFIASAAAAGFVRRFTIVACIGAAAAITAHLGNWIWYAYPVDYTLAQMLLNFVSYALAGLGIAFVLGWSRKAKPAA